MQMNEIMSKVKFYMIRFSFLSFVVSFFALTMISCGGGDDGDTPTPKPQPQPDPEPDPEPVVVVKDGTFIQATLPASPTAQWSKGDELSVLTLSRITPNTYAAAGDVASATAALSLLSGNADIVDDDMPLIAYTDNMYIKGISANNDDEMVLNQLIPRRYEAPDVGSTGSVVPRPVALWAPVTFDDKGKMQAQLQHLTAVLCIQASDIPAGTRALLFVNHDKFKLNGETVQGGRNEALSGLFTAVLSGSPALAPDEDAVMSDTLRVNLTSEESYERYYVPIAAGTYSNLLVLALTGDILSFYDSQTYNWKGQALFQYKNKTFVSGTVYNAK